jgi:exopolyphosphatase/guanosine-5'-triphosphate,3'-diphosphate pyrophosphatase
LGEGFYESNRLQPQAIERTARAVAEFVSLARFHGADHVRVVATSAAREADNPGHLVEAVQKHAGLPIEIIDGDLEAELAYQGAVTNLGLGGNRVLILDVGGGSTEFILGEGQRRIVQRSVPLGAVRLLEQFRPADPPLASDLERCRSWLREFLEASVKPALGGLLLERPNAVCLTGTGGTAVILICMEIGLDGYDRARVEAARLSAAALRRRVDSLWGMPLAERRKIRELPPHRADVMLTGAAIYEAVMEQFGFLEMRASTRGLRFAAVLPAGQAS